MEKNGGYGGDLPGPGFGSEGLLVPPDEEEDDSRALRVALGQLSLLGLGEGEDGGGAPTTGVQDRSNNNNNHHNHTNSVGGGGDTAILQGKSKLCALYESSSSETKGRGCNITECVPVPSSEHVAEIVGRQGKLACEFYSPAPPNFCVPSSVTVLLYFCVLFFLLYSVTVTWCYLTKKREWCVRSRAFCAPLRHQPPTFFPATILQVLMRSSWGHTMKASRLLLLCVCLTISGVFYTYELENLVDCWANYSTSTPSMSAHIDKHIGSRKALASFVV